MRIVSVSIFIFLTFILNAQTNTYLADLTALKSIVEKTKSFKTQIKRDERSNYNDLFKRLASDTTNNPNTYQYFYNLAQLVFPIRDNHLGFYQLPNYNYFKTKESIDSFVKTIEFSAYPSLNINMDSLKMQLTSKPAESVEGIYHYDKFYTVGLFKNAKKEYIGVVLDSDINLWVKGQIAIHLYETAPNLYKAIYGHPAYKYFLLQPVEKYQNQSLVNASFYGAFTSNVYSKKTQSVDYVNLPKNSSKFVLRNINDVVQYLLIQTFQNNTTSHSHQNGFMIPSKLC